MEIKDNFEFKEKIGEGNFADVWKAIDNIGREVAIKIFKPSAVFVSNEANLENTISKMLLNHARLLAQVDHPNVVKIHHVTQVKDPINGNVVDAIVMEYLHGITLEKRLKTVLSIDEAVLIANSIIDGMEAIHNKNIVHNDLHANNIIICSNNVKIIDPRYDETSFVLLSSITKEQQVKSDIRYLKETLRDIICKTPDVSMEKADLFRNNTRDEINIQKIKEYFNEALANKLVNGSQMVVTSTSISVQENTNDTENILEKVKEYISDERYKIKLDNLVTSELKQTLPKLDKEHFPLRTPEISSETIISRLNSYENSVINLETILITLSQWGTSKYLPLFNKIIERLSDNIEMEGGYTYWVQLRWYPLLLLAYCSGISAISSENYQYLYSLFLCKMPNDGDTYYENKYLINMLTKNLTQLDRGDEIFKTIPEYKNKFVPVSEYMVNVVKPILEDILFLGKSYDTLFDKYEIFFSLVYADLNTNGRYGPTGRFVYKYKDRFGRSVSKINSYNELINEASLKKDNWEPLKAGFFNGSYERFVEVSNEYKSFMESLQWY